MASIAVIAGGALVNALAFSGTNFVFSQIGDHGKEEMRRHNQAMEKLAKAREQYSQERQKRLDFLNKTIREKRHAEQTFSDLGVAMRQYADVTGHELPPLKEPKLSDFYNPSRQRKDAEVMLVIGGMSVLGFLAYKMH